MRFTAVLAPLALVATTVFGQAIVESLNTVNDKTLQLGKAVTNWNGKLFSALPIVKVSADVLASIQKGTKATKKSEPLDFLGALGVAEATTKLAVSVNSSLTTLIDAKPKFDKLLLSPVILTTLGVQKKATTEMSAAIIEKVPAELREIAGELVKPIDASFELAIDAYHPF
ncbi:hypothetical protein OQA88_2915 [Cercophora sp. LCS_1]